MSVVLNTSASEEEKLNKIEKQQTIGHKEKRLRKGAARHDIMQPQDLTNYSDLPT